MKDQTTVHHMPRFSGASKSRLAHLAEALSLNADGDKTLIGLISVIGLQCASRLSKRNASREKKQG